MKARGIWIFLALACSALRLAAQVGAPSYEWAMISRGDNRPDFDPNDAGLKAVIVGLHQQLPPAEIRKAAGMSPGEYEEKLNFLKSKNYVHDIKGTDRPSCMVVSDGEGRELFARAEPLAQRIAETIRADLEALKGQYLKTGLARIIDIDRISFFVLSDVLLDNWQISRVEAEFLARERPLRHGKNYYCAFFQNLHFPKEPFGIYGNAVFGRFSVYGNNRKFLDRNPSGDKLKEMILISDEDNAALEKMADSYAPTLIGILKSNRSDIDRAYRETRYSEEVSFEEFFIWWYHFIYTRATDILAENNLLAVPESGNFFYRIGSPPGP